MSKTSDTGTLLLVAAVAAAGLYLYKNGLAGLIKPLASIFGIPATDPAAGATAFKNGDYMTASKLLPAADFIKAVTTGGASLDWSNTATTVAAPVATEADLTAWLEARGVTVPPDPAAVQAAIYASDFQYPTTPSYLDNVTSGLTDAAAAGMQ